MRPPHALPQAKLGATSVQVVRKRTANFYPAGDRARHRPSSWLHLVGGLLLVISVVLTERNARAQETGAVSGVVVSTWDATPLAGVTITVRGTTLATKTDANGRYELKGVPAGDQVLRFAKGGFASSVVTDVRVLIGQTTTVNGNLRPEFFEMEEYQVTAEEFTEQTQKIMIERQKSSVMIEALGSDFLARVGAGNAAESIAKVSGATIVEGKFAVIRGLNDRYVTTTLNGAKLPSADPYRQSASLDLFPSPVIDRVVVAKTFTPDQPGTFTGGGIDIITKSFPEKPFLSFSLGGAFNSQATYNHRFLTYEGGGLDWAAMDDGTRALPKALTGQATPFPPFASGVIGTPLYDQNVSNAVVLDKLTRALGPAQFAPTREGPPFNQNFSAAGGGSVKVFDGVFGYFAGVSYKHDYSFYEDGISSRYQSGTELRNSYTDARSLSIVNWSGMLNLAYKPFEDHELGFTFFYNQNGTDDTRIQEHGFESTDITSTFRKFNLYWTERNLNTYQIKGSHRFPQIGGLKFDWLVALTQTTQDEPNARFFNDIDPGSGFSTGGNSVPIPSNPTRYFRNLDENNQNVKLDWTLPFHNWTKEEGQFRFGLFDSSSDRTFLDRAFSYPGGGGYSNDPNNLVVATNLGIAQLRTNIVRGVPRSLTYFWNQYIQGFDSLYDAGLDVQAGYLMADIPVFDKLRLVGGVRYETTDLNVFSVSYRASSITGLHSNNTSLVAFDLLPSAGLILSPIQNMNFRLNYSQTIARPSFREVAAYFSYDPVINDYVEGNPLLKMSAIENYDARWEWFPGQGDLVSVSLFYKDLSNAIERGDLKQEGDVITFFNRDKAKLYGVEFEARKNLGFLGKPLSPFSLGGNLALVQSEVKLTPEELFNKRAFFPNLKGTRPLYDQSPYILNLDLNYNNLRAGTTASLIFNIAGERIAIAKLNTEDVYEQPAAALDFVLSQQVAPHTVVKFAAKNLLDPQIERTYGKSSKLFYDSYKRGRLFAVSLNFDF